MTDYCAIQHADAQSHLEGTGKEVGQRPQLGPKPPALSLPSRQMELTSPRASCGPCDPGTGFVVLFNFNKFES